MVLCWEWLGPSAAGGRCVLPLVAPWLLELGEPLSAEYRRFAHTGEGGFGDPGEVISLGRVADVTREPRATVMIPSALEARLETAYTSGVASLRDRCEALAAA